MQTFRQQRTISQPVTVAGTGYWSGQEVEVEFCPAAVDTGITFVRRDLQPPVRIPATVHHRIEIPRRTTLSVDGTAVEMVEHIMAALAGLWIDNCEVRVSGPEMPGCDGSSNAFVEALESAGIVEQDVPRPRLIVHEETRVGDDEAWVTARPSRTGKLTVKYRLNYGPHSAIGRQTIELPITPRSFADELAPARTFILEAEAQWLREQGLGSRVTYQDLLVIGENGPINNPFRFEDECVRHKALDLVGDLALAGCDLIGHFVAYRSGHRLNAEMVRALLAEGRIEEGHRRSA